MEKRRDENAAPLHVHAASTDPGYIPGITPSKPVAPEDADAPVAPASDEGTAAGAADEPDATASEKPEQTQEPQEARKLRKPQEPEPDEPDEDEQATAEPESDTAADADTAADTAADANADADAAAGQDDEAAAPEDEDEGAGAGEGDGADSPSFEARDHRGSITIDRSGLRFRLDDQEADFDWDEIGAVEHSTSRFGRRLTVTAYTLARRAYPAEVQAPDKATLKRWDAELDDVLDAYFEE